MTTKTKICTKCGCEKDLSCFYFKLRGSVRRPFAACMSCHNQQCKEARAERVKHKREMLKTVEKPVNKLEILCAETCIGPWYWQYFGAFQETEMQRV